VTARVLGIGGIFFKARDPERLLAWYREHLGLDVGEWGGVVFEASLASPDDLDEILAALRSEGCEVETSGWRARSTAALAGWRIPKAIGWLWEPSRGQGA
jgi:catechol 2,3-dioxygenase-like lactoylglutathione lyase family enzyme